MASYPIRPFAAPAWPAERRLAGASITILIHVALILGWQMARTLPQALPSDAPSLIQWIRLPPLAAHPPVAPPPPVDARRRPHPAAVRSAPSGLTTIPAAPVPAPASAPNEPGTSPAPAFAPDAPSRAGADTIMENARRSAGSIDRALRSDNRPYIAAPLDSPQLRMRSSMEQAHAMAPNRLWEAPKVEELVNNTGDGARRTRVITGNGTYCITERSPVTSIDMIEKHGKLRLTNCPQHEDPATQQAWRTARD